MKPSFRKSSTTRRLDGGSSRIVERKLSLGGSPSRSRAVSPAVRRQRVRASAPGPGGGVVYTGDVVLLSAAQPGGVKCYLCGEGVVDEDLAVAEQGQDDEGCLDVRDCMFRVVPQLCYAALKEWRQNKHADPASLADKLGNEERENKLRQALCNPVRYGDSVQLLHVKSGKYVTVLPKVMGRRGRGTLRVCLQEGSKSSTFTVLPFYKYKGVGESVLYDQQVLFAAQKPGPSWFLHYSLAEDGAAPGAPGLHARYELNCSTEPQSGFFPQLFSRRNDSLQFGHVVRITCPQSERALGASCNAGAAKRPYYRHRETDKHGLWSKGAWALETPERMRGGDVRWCSLEPPGDWAEAAVCLRHLGSGLYLAVDEQATPDWAGQDRQGERTCQARLVPVPDESCYFCLESLVRESGPVRMGADGRTRALLRFEDGWGRLWLSYDPGLFKKERDERPRPALQPYFGETRNANNALIIECLSQTQPDFIMDATRALSWRASYMRTIASFKAMQRSASRLEGDGAGSGTQKTPEELFGEIECTTAAAIRFATKSDAADALRRPERPSPLAQRLLRELKLLDASMELLEVLWATGWRLTRLTTRTEVRLETADQGGEQPSARREQPEPQVKSLRLLLELWRCSFQDNRRTEMYFSHKGWLEKINDLNGLGLGASKCLAALVSNNRQLLHDVTVATMQKFVDFVRHLGPDETWLNFLQAVCSCQGHALADKQQAVLQMVYQPGDYATSEEKSKWGGNRRRFLLAAKLAEGPKFQLPPAVHFGDWAEDLPGKSLAVLGVRDVRVSWATSEEPWKIGSDWLYFHPRHLGLSVKGEDGADRSWVSLADLAWVLNPECTYGALHPGADRDTWAKDIEQMKPKGSFKARELLATYFVAQVNMLRQLCVCNQVHSMKAIQEEYSFDLLCCALWDHTLAPTMRRAFCELLDVLWVNRPPHSAVQLVPLCHTVSGLSLGKAGELSLPAFQLDPDCLEGQKCSSFDAQPSAAKFCLLLAYVRHHFNSLRGRMVHSHAGLAGYTAAVTRLFLDLLKFGFVNTEEGLVSVLQPLLACLDGRTDWLDGPEENAEAEAHLRRLSAELGSQESSGTPRSAESPSPLLSSRDGSTRGGDAVALGSLLPDVADGHKRYRTRPESASLIDAKVLMCEVCALVVEIFVGNGVAQLARLFMDWRGSRDAGQMDKAPSRSEVRQALTLMSPKQLDLDLLAGTNFNILLADLMMYESPRLFTAAAKVMRLWRRRGHEILERATELIIIGSPEMSRMHHKLKSHVAHLSNLISTCRDWGLNNAHGPVDHSRFQEAERLLQSLRALCTQGGEEIDSEEPNSFVQSLLASMRLGEELMRAFVLPDERSDSEGVLNDFGTSICKLLYQFANGHARNQQVLYGYLPKLQEWNASHKEASAAIAIAGIFRGNRRLCEKLSEETVYNFGQALVQSRRSSDFQPERLEFLLSVLVTGQRPILRNKEIVLSMLRNPAYDKVLHLLQDSEGLQRRDALLLHFRGLGELSKPPMLRSWTGGDAELQYHLKTLELLALLCTGRDQTGASGFVESKMPPNQLVDSYLALVELERSDDRTADCKHMCSVLKRALLALLINVHYNTNVRDVIFLSLELHVVLLTVIIDEFDSLCSKMVQGTLTSDDRELLFKTLIALMSLVEFTPRSKWHPDIEALLGTRLRAAFSSLPKTLGLAEDQAIMRTKAHLSRVLAWLSQDREAVHLRISEMLELQSVGPSEELDARSGQLTSSCRRFVEHLREDPAVKQALQEQHDALVRDVRQLRRNTDPADPAYLEKRGAASAGFRRNAITTVELIQRAISHCLQADHIRDRETTQFVIELLSDILTAFADDREQLQHMQSMCAKCGGQRLVVDTLCARPDSELFQQCLSLASLLLKPNNKEVQMIFSNYFIKIDDYQLWNLLREMIGAVTSNVKPVRQLKKVLQHAGAAGEVELTADEKESLGNFSASITTLKHAARFMQLLCEGHNMVFQRYVKQQVDNSYSINFLEVFAGVCIGLCKNEAAADVCDEEDVACMSICFELLSEATTRPDSDNQFYLANDSGIVLCAVKVLAARFSQLRRLCGRSCYPERARELKAQASQLLLVLLEMRADTVIHRAIIMNMDAKLLIRRIIFVHRWFLSEHLGLSGSAEVHLCTNTGRLGALLTCTLDDPTKDDGMQAPTTPPQELLENYEEHELVEMFGEAFNLMTLALMLEPHDSGFAAQIDPVSPSFDENLKLRVNSEVFAEAQAAYRMACNYQAAHRFFDKWIRMIEVQADGRVFDLYFRMPVICDYVLGKEKAAILDEVNIESSEAKVKDFIKRCEALYDLTLHTWSLSKWSPCPCWPCKRSRYCGPPRPLLFWLKNDSRNLVRTSYLCYAVALLVNALLFEALLLPKGRERGAAPGFRDRTTQLVVFVAGLLYLVLMLISLFVFCLTYSPLDYAKVWHASQASERRYKETAAPLLVAAATVSVPLLHGRGRLAIVVAPMLIYFCGRSWQEDGRGCPRNCAARSLVTCYLGLRRQEIMRFLSLAIIAAIATSGVEFFYTFLLLDVLFMFEKLQNVVKAVVMPLSSLFMTMMAGTILSYEYAVVAFFYFRHDYGEDCENMVDCTVTTLYLGLRREIGYFIAPVTVQSSHWYGRVVFDLSFFLLITTVLMNILFGIIVDTFGTLRYRVTTRELYKRSTTFIASLERSEIDKACLADGISSGFDYLENDRQHCWNYMNFIFYLRHKDQLNFMGPETRIAQLIAKEDISWVPLNTCSLLQRQADAAEAAGAGSPVA